MPSVGTPGIRDETCCVAGAAIASSSAVVSPAARSGALAQGTPAASADFNWRRYEGESIDVLLAVSPRADLLVEYQPEFEELTGITANTDVVPERNSARSRSSSSPPAIPASTSPRSPGTSRRGCSARVGFCSTCRNSSMTRR